MTVPTEAAYAELIWTGVETVFTPGFTAEAVDGVHLSYLDADGLPVALTRGVHFNASLDSALNVTVTPVALPAATALAPVTLVMQRDTPAVQGTDFKNLQRYNASVHQTLFDRAFRVLADLKGRVSRAVAPFFVSDTVVDFRPRRLKAADPVVDADVATKLWVLTITGVIDLQQYVIAVAASAAAAAASALEAMGFQTAANAARDMAQAWSDTPENSNVPGTMEFSAFHWSRKAAAAAASVVPYLALIDYGFFSDAPTDTRDYGSFS